MSNEKLLEMYRAGRSASERHTFFLLAASGSAIGFAVTQTKGLALSAPMSLLGFAVLFWGISFFCGCRHLEAVSSSLYANYSLLQVQIGEHPALSQDPRVAAIAIPEIRKALEMHGDLAGKYARNQFRFLILGALAYLAWHILEMYLRT